MRNLARYVGPMVLGLGLANHALAGEPALPAGLGGAPAQTQEPSLPMGLDGLEAAPAQEKKEKATAWDALEVGGFYELRYGHRLSGVGNYKDTTLGEARFQLEATWSGDWATFNLTTDLVADQVLEDGAVDLETGEGWIDLREASVLLRPLDTLDLKIGRQVLTWGTGDLVFINDLFPKDWNAFFIGRDDEYLKAPSDAIKASVYVGGISLDAVLTPRFDSDRFIDGRRLTFFDPLAGGLKTQPLALSVESRDQYGDDWEGAFRASGQVKSFEWAGYLYRGYWKSPTGFDPLSGQNTFPELNVYGASLRGPLGGGIAHGEIGYYDARDGGAASDPFVPNSEWRFLAGFEREIIPDLTGSIQVYVEHMSDHDDYLATLPMGMRPKDETRQLITVRLTQMLMNQNLMLSAFNFWSPTDEDGYLRLKANYKVSDAWQIETGANVFYGAETASFFGQFEDNSNVFVSARMSF